MSFAHILCISLQLTLVTYGQQIRFENVSDGVYKVENINTGVITLFDTKTRGCSVTGIGQVNKTDWLMYSYCAFVKSGECFKFF